MSWKTELIERAFKYTDQNNLLVVEELGFGVHGIVFVAEGIAKDGQSAVKVHVQQSAYRRERDVYLRLLELSIFKIRGCKVPELRYFDDHLMVLEMTIVTRPYVLDFGGAYLENVPVFSDDVMADYLAEKREQFGEDWPEAQAILRILESYGIFVVDVNPNNIAVRPLPPIAK